MTFSLERDEVNKNGLGPRRVHSSPSGSGSAPRGPRRVPRSPRVSDTVSAGSRRPLRSGQVDELTTKAHAFALEEDALRDRSDAIEVRGEPARAIDDPLAGDTCVRARVERPADLATAPRTSQEHRDLPVRGHPPARDAPHDRVDGRVPVRQRQSTDTTSIGVSRPRSSSDRGSPAANRVPATVSRLARI